MTQLGSGIKIEFRFFHLFLIFTLILLLPFTGTSQGNKVKPLDVTIVPGFGTSGLDHDLSKNYIALNLFSGYYSQTLLLQVSTISGSNRFSSSGLHLAGVGNFTGVNLKSLDAENYESELVPFVHFYGLQASGVINLVRGGIVGGQFAGLFNLVHRETIGLQLSGLFNATGKYMFGAQLSGIGNYTNGSVIGLQLSALFNKAGEELNGLQIALVNSAKNIEGKYSQLGSKRTGIQVGVVNIAGKMNGTQIGLINYSKSAQGTQVGLINFYKGGTTSETKDGIAIGLLNIGKLQFFSIYTNESFHFNYEIGTGTRRNQRIKMAKNNVYIVNSVLYSHQSFTEDSWGVGYGLKRMIFNKSNIPGMVESKFIDYGIELQHVSNSNDEFSTNLSLLTRLKFSIGSRIAPKLFGFNWFVSCSVNGYWHKSKRSPAPDSISSSIKLRDINLDYWPGLSFGLLLH